MSVIFFAGLSWKLIVPPVVIGLIAVALIVGYESTLCADGFDWRVLHDYQKQRICTLLDPTKDPLGKGFHIIQGMIAIGSGGVGGKGFMQGTQTHLEFVPERTTDFIFAAYSEEFGLVGNGFLIIAFVCLIFRGLAIAMDAPTPKVPCACWPHGHHDLLHLCLREHGHGERHPACGGCAPALHQLRRHRDGDAGPGAGHPDVDLARQAAHAVVGGGSPAARRARHPAICSPCGDADNLREQ